ncbi:MAG: RHS repeat-associated core domain-containing protein [Gemmataceae bacterium]|nr:RHS repeat-associated core domain-containing protein [Gemmataceae bacterium]
MVGRVQFPGLLGCFLLLLTLRELLRGGYKSTIESLRDVECKIEIFDNGSPDPSVSGDFYKSSNTFRINQVNLNGQRQELVIKDQTATSITKGAKGVIGASKAPATHPSSRCDAWFILGLDLLGPSKMKATTTRRLYLDAVDAVFARIDDAGNLDWYLTDRLGSIRDIMDDASTIQDHIDYGGFGVADETEPGYGDRYKWTGRELDSATGLQYNRARWYSFDIVGWMSVDPIGFAAGDANLYRYVGNSPTSATDPSGLAAEGQVRAAYWYSTDLTIQYGVTKGRKFSDAQIQQMFDQVQQMSSAPDNHQPNPLYNDWIARFTQGIGAAYDFGRGFVAGVGSQAWGLITGLGEAIASPKQTLIAMGQFVAQLASNLWDGEFARAFRLAFPDVYGLVTQWDNLENYDKGRLAG